MALYNVSCICLQHNIVLQGRNTTDIAVKAPCIVYLTSFIHDSSSEKKKLVWEKPEMEEHFYDLARDILWKREIPKKMKNCVYLNMTAFFQQHVWA
jgi:hypothetical protein